MFNLGNKSSLFWMMLKVTLTFLCVSAFTGSEKTLQSNPGGDISLLLAPSRDQQLHFLHS